MNNEFGKIIVSITNVELKAYVEVFVTQDVPDLIFLKVLAVLAHEILNPLNRRPCFADNLVNNRIPQIRNQK